MCFSLHHYCCALLRVKKSEMGLLVEKIGCKATTYGPLENLTRGHSRYLNWRTNNGRMPPWEEDGERETREGDTQQNAGESK